MRGSRSFAQMVTEDSGRSFAHSLLLLWGKSVIDSAHFGEHQNPESR